MAAKILCPTRGGKGSYANQDRAIALAKERGQELLFLYITNISFLDLIAGPIVVDIETELDEMGEFLLAMAQERADKAEVKSEAIVRRGDFKEVLLDVIREHEIETVIMGSSAGETGVIRLEYIEGMIKDISGRTGIEFIVVDQGEVVYTYKS